MGRFEIEGGNPLVGEIVVSGAKNEALKVIPFSILVQKKFTAHNVPNIADIRKQLEILEDLGGSYSFDDNTLEIDGTTVSKSSLKNGLATKLRASIVYLGPLLARFKKVSVPFPGGCAIGQRPIDSHIEAFKALGAKVKCEGEKYEIEFDEFISNTVKLSEPSVTATENILMFLSYFEEDFTILNCAIEPEIMALCEILKSAGAEIELDGERTIKIRGSRELSLDEVQVVPDRIEAFSYLVAFLATGGEGTIQNFPTSFMKEPLEILRKSGALLEFKQDVVEIKKSPAFQPFSLVTAPYPGFPTDMQSPMSLIAAIATGESKITEAMFENRLAYIEELKKMGLTAEVTGNSVTIVGPSELHGSKITSLDLRSGITLVLAALVASGKSEILKSEIIDRGYEDLVEKLTAIGAKIKRND